MAINFRKLVLGGLIGFGLCLPMAVAGCGDGDGGGDAAGGPGDAIDEAVTGGDPAEVDGEGAPDTESPNTEAPDPK